MQLERKDATFLATAALLTIIISQLCFNSYPDIKGLEFQFIVYFMSFVIGVFATSILYLSYKSHKESMSNNQREQNIKHIHSMLNDNLTRMTKAGDHSDVVAHLLKNEFLIAVSRVHSTIAIGTVDAQAFPRRLSDLAMFALSINMNEYETEDALRYLAIFDVLHKHNMDIPVYDEGQPQRFTSILTSTLN